MKWVKLSKYCELTGETPDSFKSKRKKGLFAEGRHFKIIEKHIWINLAEMERWADNYQEAS